MSESLSMRTNWIKLRHAIRIATALAVVAATIAVSVWMVLVVIRPGYENPRSRMYTSKLGQANRMRKAEQPFEVETCQAEVRTLRSTFVGEGMIQTEAVQIPLIAMSRILKVNAEEGQQVHKGQVLVELDSSRLQIKINACQAALDIANAEYERTRIGSAYVLDMERPDRDTIRLDGVQREGALLDEMHAMYQSLASDQYITRAELIEHQLRIEQHHTRLREMKLSLRRAVRGRKHSLDVAASAIQEAKLALEHRKNEMRDYTVICPADGLVERRFIHPGEYNQDPGRPAFLVTTGRWFEAHFDQTTWGQFRVGDRAEVLLEACPGEPIDARVVKIHPYVSYSLGGPEINRPIRPLGSGAPEWPATYTVRLELDADPDSIVPGMTGFARVEATREALALPRSSIRSLSSGRAMVVLENAGNPQPHPVRVGWENDGWVELRSELPAGLPVIRTGHETLLSGDKVRVTGSDERGENLNAIVETLAEREAPQG